MTQTAHVVDGIVRDILSAPEGRTLADVYPGAMLATCFDAPDAVQPGWTYDGTAFAAPVPPPSLPPSLDQLRVYAASARYARETGGIVVGTAPIATDRDSQAIITGAYAYVQANPSATINFKTSGGFVALSAAQITSIAMAVGAHVQACFAAEAQVDAELSASPPTITTTAQIDTAFAAVTA